MIRIVFFLALVLIGVPSFAAESLGDFIIHHISDSDSWHFLPFVSPIHLPADWQIGPINMGISLHVLMMFIDFVLLILLLKLASNRNMYMPTSKWGHIIEAVVLYVRDEIVVPNVGKKDAAEWTPFFLTVFFFILGLNLIGLIPGMATATGNLAVTSALAIVTFLMFNGSGIKKNGPIGYFTGLIPSGIPWPVLFILGPVEILGLFTRTFALAIRLFANMSAGHIIIFSLFGMITIFKSWLLAPIFTGFALFIYLIEILVAFLQAYVFTLLSALFVGMSIHQDH